MDILLIVISIFLALVIIGVSFYMLVIYCHPEESAMGSSVVSKIIIVLGLGLSWGQLLLVPLDVSNSLNNGGINMEIVYTAVYITILIYLVTISPFTMFLYESDEEDSLCSRVTWSLVYTIIIAGIVCALIFVSQIWLSIYGPGLNVPTGLYIMVCLAFFGQILLSIFGGIGILALPVDLIAAFTNRPKPLKPEQAKEKKTELQEVSSKLVSMGDQLREQEAKLAQSDGWWETRKQKNKLNKKFEEFKEQVMSLEESYETFQAELKIAEQNPVVPYLSLFVGILCVIFSSVWLLQISFDVVLQPNNTPVWTVLDGVFASMNTGGLTFLATGLFGILTLYLLWCVQKGNVSFGLRIPFIVTFHPMQKNQTYLNSFLFNINMMLLASVATTQLSVNAFNQYTAGSYIGMVYTVMVPNLPFFGWLYVHRVFPMAFMVIFLIYGLYLIVNAILKCRKKKKAA